MTHEDLEEALAKCDATPAQAPDRYIAADLAAARQQARIKALEEALGIVLGVQTESLPNSSVAETCSYRSAAHRIAAKIRAAIVTLEAR